MTYSQEAVVGVLRDGLKAKRPRDALLQDLIKLGVPNAEAEDVFSLIEHGLKSGVNAAFTNNSSQPGRRRGESPLYDAAFDEGVRAFHTEVRRARLRRCAILIAVVLAVIALLFVLVRLVR